MKLKGFLVSFPVCDWRTFLEQGDPASRLPFISPRSFELKRTFISGFGVAEERTNLRAPWRPTETVFFDCSRALRLPNEARLLPDGSPVTDVVRRVYLDNGALVRLEFGLFANAKHHFPESKGSLHEYARQLWQTPVTRIENGQQHSETVATALPKLVQRFEYATSKQHTLSDKAFCISLEPQIQVVAEVSIDKLDKSATRIDTEGNIWMAVRPLKMGGHPHHIDTTYLMYAPRYLEEQFKPRFELLRLLRRQSAWLHSDLSILTHILRRTLHSAAPTKMVVKYVLELAQGLRSAPHRDEAVRLILRALMRLMEDFHGNRISRLLLEVEGSGLPDDLKRNLKTALDYSGR